MPIFYNSLISYLSEFNRNGKHLTDFILHNELDCLNTKFTEKGNKLWTYWLKGNSFTNQLNYSRQEMDTFISVSFDNRIENAKLKSQEK